MNKKSVILILILLLFLFLRSRASKPLSQTTTALTPDKPEDGTYTGKYEWKYYRVKSGDTLYKIAQKYIPLEKARKENKDMRDANGRLLEDKDLILMYAEQLANANGFDWSLFDSKPTKELRDPDTLAVGQKLIVWSWDSFRSNNPEGFLLPYSQYNKFNSFEPTDEYEHMRLAFSNNPPK